MGMEATTADMAAEVTGVTMVVAGDMGAETMAAVLIVAGTATQVSRGAGRAAGGAAVAEDVAAAIAKRGGQLSSELGLVGSDEPHRTNWPASVLGLPPIVPR
jgi:hypothetical protein